MARIARYYCPICLMDTEFRVSGSGARKVFVCSECCVEFMQEPQSAAPERCADEQTIGCEPTEVGSGAAPTAGLDGAETRILSEAIIDEPPSPAVADPRTGCFPAQDAPQESSAAAGVPNEELPALGVLGPTSGGKSIYIARLIDRLSRCALVLDGDLQFYTTPFQDAGSWAELSKEVLDPLRRGAWPANTPRLLSRTIDIRLRGLRRGQPAGEDYRLRFLDCAGETLLGWLKNQCRAGEDPAFDPLFESEEMARTHARIDAVMRSSRALLLLVSPEHSPALDGAGAGGAGEDFAGYFFQYLFDFQKQARTKYHIAIAFTKYDRFRTLIDPDDVEDFARRYFAPMYQTLRGFFDGQYRCFAISSVGHIHHPLGIDGLPLVGTDNPSKGADGWPAPLARAVGVEQPVRWLLERLREEGGLVPGGGGGDVSR